MIGYQRLKVVFDGPPGPKPGRFIEVEREDGSGVNAGEWENLGDGTWALWFHVIDEDVKSNICGFCGEPGADKIPHPVRWPGEESAGTKYIHADCEDEECMRAHALLSDVERQQFLSTLLRVF